MSLKLIRVEWGWFLWVCCVKCSIILHTKRIVFMICDLVCSECIFNDWHCKLKKSWGMIWFMIHPVLFSNSSLLFDYGMVLFIKAQKRLWHLGLMNCCVVMSLTLYYLEYFAELHDDDLDRLLNHNRMGSRRRRRPILTIFWAEEVVAEAVGNSYSYFDKEQLLDNSNFVVVICDCCML